MTKDEKKVILQQPRPAPQIPQRHNIPQANNFPKPILKPVQQMNQQNQMPRQMPPQMPPQRPQNQIPRQLPPKSNAPILPQSNQQRQNFQPRIIKITRPWHVAQNQQVHQQKQPPQNQNPQMKLNNPSLKPIDQVIKDIMQKRNELKNSLTKKYQNQNQKLNFQNNANKDKK